MTRDGPRISVLHVTEPVDGGVAHCVADLAGDQAARGWDVTVLAPADAGFRAALEGAGARVVPWNLPVRRAPERAAALPGVSLARALLQLRRAVRERRAGVVHLHSSQAGLAGRLVVRGRLPTVFQPHAWSFLAATGAPRRAALRWERAAARWTTVVVCVSEAERRLGEQAGIRADWRVIRNGVDLVTAASGGDRAGARSRLGLGGAPLAVCVGALRRQKGQDVLLQAWPQVRARVPAARLALVGDGPDRRALEAAAGEGVVFTGHRSDVADWHAAADVVVLPSRWEGLSLVLLEAMAAGRSVVATDVAGAAEALGEAGAVVPVGAAAPLADAVVERLLDPGRSTREGAAGRTRAELHHDVRATREAVAALYRTVTVDGLRPA